MKIHAVQFSLIASALLAVCPALSGAGDWIDLFNGHDLSGWVQHGGRAKFTAEDGVIVGTATRGEPNSFLCTARDFGDFELELEFKVDLRLNSGVQFRSAVLDHETPALDLDGTPLVNKNGAPMRIPAGRVHGYQCEIDAIPANDRWWTGGLYDEARRGWLVPGKAGSDPATFTREGRDMTRPGEWNHLRIVARGPHLQIWLNGNPRTDIMDSMASSGLIALQVHQVSDDLAAEAPQVRFRHLRLRDLSPTGNPS